MKTPTLVLATILAMAVVGDSANMEKILQQLGFPTGKGPTDDVNVNHKDKAQEKGKGTQFNSKPAKPPALDTANAVDEKASKAYGEKGKGFIPDITKILADKVPKVKGGTKFTSGPTQAGIPVNAITRATNKVEEKALPTQPSMKPYNRN
ncbi:PREDICTED: uncharacterized protein LOC109474723 [Branchiostoma belcheri]|uniref:Uncharacterized protein LOC109474723 n=1 Tax=Branchiostoma belcheri TaxID=7741 RepID=A0A6P4ZLZ5_BRABE|nr:PREDICTED: uncharacterized protein LOC109474723 [Branchiostoma belcheri]